MTTPRLDFQQSHSRTRAFPWERIPYFSEKYITTAVWLGEKYQGMERDVQIREWYSFPTLMGVQSVVSAGIAQALEEPIGLVCIYNPELTESQHFFCRFLCLQTPVLRNLFVFGTAPSQIRKWISSISSPPLWPDTKLSRTCCKLDWRLWQSKHSSILWIPLTDTQYWNSCRQEASGCSQG